MTKYHYHAEMEGCSHKLGFDVNVDLLQVTIDGGGDDAVVEIPCGGCGGQMRSSVPGSLMPGGQDVQFCAICRKGFE